MLHIDGSLCLFAGNKMGIAVVNSTQDAAALMKWHAEHGPQRPLRIWPLTTLTSGHKSRQWQAAVATLSGAPACFSSFRMLCHFQQLHCWNHIDCL